MTEIAQASPAARDPLLVACASAGTLAGGIALMAQRTLEAAGSAEGSLAMGGETRAAMVALVLVAAASVWTWLGRGRAAGVTLLGFGLGAHAILFVASLVANGPGWQAALGLPGGWIVLLATVAHLGTGAAAAVRLWRRA